MNGQRRSSKFHKRKMRNSYVGFLVLLSVSVALMPVASAVKETTRVLMAIIGILFWIGVVGILTKTRSISKRRKKSDDFNKAYPKAKQFGLIHFFQNKNAAIMDVLMFVSLGGLILCRIYVRNIVLPFICLSLFVFSFGMHCMLNGINYKYLMYDAKRGIES